MTDRYDVCTPRQRGDKTFWLRIGSAFPAKSGDGINIIFDALPLPDKDGRCAVSLFPAKPREDRQQAPQGGGAELDDDLPF